MAWTPFASAPQGWCRPGEGVTGAGKRYKQRTGKRCRCKTGDVEGRLKVGENIQENTQVMELQENVQMMELQENVQVKVQVMESQVKVQVKAQVM